MSTRRTHQRSLRPSHPDRRARQSTMMQQCVLAAVRMLSVQYCSRVDEHGLTEHSSWAASPPPCVNLLLMSLGLTAWTELYSDDTMSSEIDCGVSVVNKVSESNRTSKLWHHEWVLSLVWQHDSLSCRPVMVLGGLSAGWQYQQKHDYRCGGCRR